MRRVMAVVVASTLALACGSGGGAPRPDAAREASAPRDAAREASSPRDATLLDAAHDARRGAPTPDASDAAAPPRDASSNRDAPDASDGASPFACPTSGPGAIAPDSPCLAFTPTETGADPAGQNAGVPSYALRANGASNGAVVLFLNGTGSSPAACIASPRKNFYLAATSLGYAVVALSYRSTTRPVVLCGDTSASDDACYFPTRQTLIEGVLQPGAAAGVADILPSEGIVPRFGLALAWLAAHDPGHGWDAFLLPGDDASGGGAQVDWTRVVVAGHSQGGGHAAACGKLFPLKRVIQLSSTCDEALGVSASWTRRDSGVWKSDPTGFWGLDTPSVVVGGVAVAGDTTCPAHAGSWANEGMVASHRDEDAATCAPDGADAGDTHPDSITCAENYAAWLTMLR